MDRICLVTGANSGIGKEAALGLALMGATVVLACRNGERGRAALNDIRQKSGSSAESYDLEEARRLWDASCELLGIKP